MDGSLGAGDLLTVAVLAAAYSCVLRLLFWPPSVHDRPAVASAPQAGQNDLCPPAERESLRPDRPDQPRHEPPAPDGLRAESIPVIDPASEVVVEGQGQGRAAGPAPVIALLVGEDPAALSAAAAATDRYLLQLVVEQGCAATQPRLATCSALNATWPAARVVVLGDIQDRTREAAVHHAAAAQVPLLLVARARNPLSRE